MTLLQEGDTVTGTYTHNGGTITGKVTDNKLIGDWSENGGTSGGKFELDMRDDCSFFSGKWEDHGAWGDHGRARGNPLRQVQV
jgi:hypothetical protein